MRGDVGLLKLAMLHDPLVAAVCNPPEVWQMTDEMLVAQAEWLPQYRASGAIAAAKKRLATGLRVKTRAGRGAARLPIKSVVQLRRERQTSVLAADEAAAARAKRNGQSR
ncbi:MAG: hypothetical protein NZ483_01525 [Verrucomicrobiae bacterium]|nr:hypothetical protein [Verrucomicrobiae bacterium]